MHTFTYTKRLSRSNPPVVVFSMLLLIAGLVAFSKGIHWRDILDISQKQKTKEITDSPHNLTTCVYKSVLLNISKRILYLSNIKEVGKYLPYCFKCCLKAW